jgi:hypothetical protein
LDESPPSQRQLIRSQDQSLWDDLVHHLTPDQANLLISAACKGTSSWLFAGSSPIAAIQLTPTEFQEFLRQRLLLPTFRDHAPIQRHCGACNISNVPPFHALVCRAPSRARKVRHDLIRDALVTLLRSIPNARVSIEVAVPSVPAPTPALQLPVTPRILPQVPLVPPQSPSRSPVDSPPSHPSSPSDEPHPEEGRGPSSLVADIRFQLGPHTWYLDTVVTAPFSYAVPRSGGIVPAGHFAKLAEQRKTSKYRRSCGEAFLQSFVPFAVECTGRLGASAISFLESIGRQDPSSPSPIPPANLRFFHQRVCAILAKASPHIQACSRATLSHMG